MQSLKALQLVEGVPEPKGGYKPTAEAYTTLDIEEIDEPASTPLSHNGEPIDEQVIQEINLMSVHHPEKCRAEFRMQGSAGLPRRRLDYFQPDTEIESRDHRHH